MNVPLKVPSEPIVVSPSRGLSLGNPVDVVATGRIVVDIVLMVAVRVVVVVVASSFVQPERKMSKMKKAIIFFIPLGIGFIK